MQNRENHILGEILKQFNFIQGRKHEIIAQNFLKKKGYKIIECNYSNEIGEIDIIAKQQDILVFVEVKFRSTSAFGLPREAVGNYKQNKIRKTALLYLQINDLFDCNIRFDVIDILGEEITHIENAF